MSNQERETAPAKTGEVAVRMVLPPEEKFARPFSPFWWAQTLIYLFTRPWNRVEVVHGERIPQDGPFLILPTHSSYYDPPLIGSYFRRQSHFLAREGILKAPLLGPLCSRLNTHPIRRGAGDREAIRVCRSILRQGFPLAFFPEGTRSRTGKLGPIQRGFVMILDGLPQVPFLPVVLQDTYRVLPRGSFFPRPRKVRIYVGEPAYLPTRLEGESTRSYFDRCAADLERRLRDLGAE
jgi:1-acyl-sn-glycerol-3-phosphate acyltransferase